MRANSIREIRRGELSRAAFEAVILYGLRKTTLEKVGDIAGVSKGVVLHHFKDKSALLEAVFRRSNTLLSGSVVELYRYAENPYERLWAIIVANFFETIFNRQVCQAWVSLISEVPHNTECQRVQIVNNERIRSNLMHELKHFYQTGRPRRWRAIWGFILMAFGYELAYCRTQSILIWLYPKWNLPSQKCCLLMK